MGTAFTGEGALTSALDELQEAKLIRYAGYDEEDAIGHCYALRQNYNWDEETIDVPMPPEVQALVAACGMAQYCLRAENGDIVSKDDIGRTLRAITAALSPFPQPVEAE